MSNKTRFLLILAAFVVAVLYAGVFVAPQSIYAQEGPNIYSWVYHIVGITAPGQATAAASFPVVLASDQGDISVTLDAEVIDVDATGQGDLPMVPFAAITELAVTEIIGIDEQVDQFEYSEATQLALGATVSGEILNVTLILSGTLTEAGTLLIFDADPSVTLADANLATASWLLAIGKIDVAAGDWFEEDSGGTGAVATFAEPIAFHALSSLWVAYYHEGATQWNSAAGDNESLDIQIEYRRDS